jgi:6-phosphogluconolactonase (cycloisomerase 2 family)
MKRTVARPQSWHVGVLTLALTALIGGVTAGRADGGNDVRAVFTLTNEPDGNRLAVFARDQAGASLAQPYFVPTGGNGTGAGLGNRGALALSDDGRFLFAVNPGSDTITVFDVSQGGVVPVQVIESQGVQPISVTAHGDLLFVLNAGGSAGFVDSIAGFTIGVRGHLHPIPRSERLLSADNTGPAQIGFNGDGTVLLVTEKNTSLITTFTVDARGNPSAPSSQAAAGIEPFGFAFTADGFLVTSEAFGGADNASALSSYAVDDAGVLTVISPSVGTQQTAACWVATTQSGAYAFATNTGSGTVSGYTIDGSGNLALLDAGGAPAETGAAPTDLTTLGDSALFVLNSADGSVDVYAVDNGGALELLQIVGQLPLTKPTGLVVR